MMRFLLTPLMTFIIFFSPLSADGNYSIVFIHIGPNLPPYTETALKQARLFNPQCPIVLIGNSDAIDRSSFRNSSLNIRCVTCESLNKTEEHLHFIEQTKWSSPFWRYSTERLYYLNDYMTDYNETNVFHLENDNMLYVDLSTLLPIFEQNYKGIAATFDNDNRCILGFVYVPNPAVMSVLGAFLSSYASESFNDMQLLAMFKNTCGDQYINNLPIISKEYVDVEPLISPMNHIAESPYDYCLNDHQFQSLFDAAALGQYLGGIDPIHEGGSNPGFINESCVFNPSLLTYEWIIDDQGRNVPYARYNEDLYRLNNLHIHCKNLELFSSQ